MSQQDTSGFYLTIRQVFVQQGWLILLTVVITTVLSGLLIFNQTPVYRAQFLLEPPQDIETSALNLKPLYFLNTAGQGDVSSAQLFQVFSSTITSPSVKQQFFTEYYLPLLTKQNNSVSVEKSYKHYLSDFRVQPEYASGQRRWLISVKADSAERAKQQLQDYLSFMNAVAQGRVVALLEERKQLVLGALVQQIQLLQQVKAAVPVTNEPSPQRANSINFKIDELTNPQHLTPSVAQQLITIYEENYRVLRNQSFTKQKIKLFYSDASKAVVWSNQIELKLKTTLIVGILSGLIVGFLLAAMRLGLMARP